MLQALFRLDDQCVLKIKKWGKVDHGDTTRTPTSPVTLLLSLSNDCAIRNWLQMTTH